MFIINLVALASIMVIIETVFSCSRVLDDNLKETLELFLFVSMGGKLSGAKTFIRITGHLGLWSRLVFKRSKRAKPALRFVRR